MNNKARLVRQTVASILFTYVVFISSAIGSLVLPLPYTMCGITLALIGMWKANRCLDLLEAEEDDR